MGAKVRAAESALKHPFHIGGFTVDPLGGFVCGPAGRQHLDPKVMDVLLLLAEQAGTVVLREDLFERVWPGVVVSDDALSRCIYQLRRHLAQAGGQDRCKELIQTLPKRGYRLNCEPPAQSASSPASSTPAMAPMRRHRNRWLLGAGIVATLLFAVLLRLGLPDRRDDRLVANATGPVPSVAVLPLVNMSSDEENEYFADGLTEEVVNKLAGIRGLKVVARSSSYRFKGKQESVAAIAEALKVNHILEGSVRRAGDRLRITVQLIDARRDENVWSETFDRAIGDIFQIQEQVAFAVAAALQVSLLDTDEFRIRNHGTGDPEAYRLYMIARAHLLGRAMAPDWGLAKRLLEEAIQRDPDFALAHASLAWYYFRHVMSTLTDPEESERLGVAAAERAVELDPTSSEARQALANFHFWRYRAHGDYEAYIAAVSDMQRAIQLDPANSLAFDDFGSAIIWHEPDLAFNLLERAISLDLLCTGPNVYIAVLLGTRGQLEAARDRCADLRTRIPVAGACDMAMGTLETYFGDFERAVLHLQAIEKSIRGPARIQLWSLHMSMGDRAGAEQWLDFGDSSMEQPLSNAARFAMEGDFDQALQVLEQYRAEFPLSHLLDFPAAKFGLIAGKPRRALEILEERLPDLASGIEPISASNVLPALDLATAQLGTGARDDAQALLEKIASYLEGPSAMRLPMFAFQRARAHALAGEADEALDALDRAYDEGLRTTWAIDLRPQSLFYIDPIETDPAFSALRDDARLGHWFERIRVDNARQLEQIKAQQVAKTISQSP